ncbi:hypothetical protein J3B02_003105 [Coemansia erecta]|uniref:Uncharacterized protein n=1 Tax=Coemansia asiatica TaxID=1052880 RepID=A0A9W8CMJ1_9FUNG|nr:hypothetical protein LPJ64_000815 [Coemansia asiatica]KAJ2853518.1 hypothetical protein J3B02_003105 [Coemansia erecta]KAJ2881147.1 hypothetical protein FB639_002680 [Coemansia asiatica]
MRLASLLLVPAAMYTMVIAMNLMNKDVPNTDIAQVPPSLSALAENNSEKINLNRRITSVRPGDLVRVSFNIPSDKTDTPDFSEIIAAVYSTKDGSLVKVLNQAPALQINGLKDAEFRGGQDIALYLPVNGLPNLKEFVIYKLALIAPERDSSGSWSKYSADTMLIAYDGAN